MQSEEVMIDEVKDESESEEMMTLPDEFGIMDPDTHGQEDIVHEDQYGGVTTEEDIVNEEQYGGVTTMEDIVNEEQYDGEEDIVNEEQYDGEHTEDEDLHIDEDEGDNDDDDGDDEGGEISRLLASAGHMQKEACPPWRANRPNLKGSIYGMGSGSKGYGGKGYGSKGKGYGGKDKGSKRYGWHVWKT